MEIRVSGHQLETGSALQEHAADRLNGISEKYFNRALSSNVTFGKAPANAFACDIVLHVNQGLILKSHGRRRTRTSRSTRLRTKSRSSCAGTSAA